MSEWQQNQCYTSLSTTTKMRKTNEIVNIAKALMRFKPISNSNISDPTQDHIDQYKETFNE